MGAAFKVINPYDNFLITLYVIQFLINNFFDRQVSEMKASSTFFFLAFNKFS
jgi:hypothetical protein